MRLACSAALLSSALVACGDDGGTVTPIQANYALSSVVIDTDGNRTMYVQAIESLDDGPFDNRNAIELAGNGVVIAHGDAFFVGLAEEPTWVRYAPNADGVIEETGRLSLANYGATYIDYGNAIVDADTAVSVLSGVPSAIVWNPTTMEVQGEIPLPHLVREGFETEVWTTIAHDGRVYVPGRWADWTGGRIFPGVSLTILDPEAMTIVAHVEDDRCASAGRPVFGPDGTIYVMGDGRTYSIHMYANATNGTAPDNCILRIKPGETEFDPDYYYSIPSLTGGLQSIAELEPGVQGTGVAFAKMFYPEELPDGVEPIDFDFWSYPATKGWRVELADPPTAEEVDGLPFSVVGFTGSAVDGKLYTGEGADTATSTVYESDPATNTARVRFTMDGYFNGLYKLTSAE